MLLVQFLAIGDEKAYPAYLEACERRVVGAGGRRVYGGRLDVVPGELARAFDELVIDLLPSRDAALAQLEEPSPEGERVLAGRHVLGVGPVGPLLGLGLRAAAWTLRRVAPIAVSEPGDGLPGGARDAAGMSPAAAEALMAADQDAPLAMMNLNQYRERAHYPPGSDAGRGGSGAAAYARYTRNTLPHLFRRGGRPLCLGRQVEVLAGAPGHPLSGEWSDFALVYYPNRRSIRHMVRDPDYQTGHPHREAGMERAVVVPGTPWPRFEPRP